MRNRLATALLFAAALSGLAFGWGDEAHRALARGAAAAVPPEMRAFFLANAEFIARHATDPDYIPNRTAEQRAEHFLDLDAYGAPPFAEIPHDRAEAEKKFGAATVIERGLLPWAVQREFDRLTEALRRNDCAEARLAAAHLSHFVADAHMPLHATANYNGQFTGNTGIHLRIEVELMPRYMNSPVVAPGPLAPMPNATEWTFAELARSYALVGPVLKADAEARQLAPLDTEAYYLELDRRLEAMLSARLKDAAGALASFYSAAWEKAGKPALPPERAVAIILDRDAPDAAFAERVCEGIALAMRRHPFNAVAVAQGNEPKSERRLSLPVFTGAEVGQKEFSVITPTGDMPSSVGLAESMLKQFPGAARTVVIVSDGWADDPAVLDAARRLKAEGIGCMVLTFGPAENAAARGKEFAQTAGGKAFHCETEVAVPPRLAGYLLGVLGELPPR